MRYYRLTYNNIGLYEALKNTIWEKSNTPKEDWRNFKNSPDANWLPTPPIYNDTKSNYRSYFTEAGYSKFMDLTLPLINKWINNDEIKTIEVEIKNSNKTIVYQDDFQIVIKE